MSAVAPSAPSRRRTLVGGAPGVIAGAVVALVLTLGWLAWSAGPAQGASGDPVRERGEVARVVDGDTIDVLVDGDSEPTRIRLSGIQAFEEGECGSDIATDRLRALVEGRRVELRARVASASSLGRPIRSVHLPLASGGTADIVEVMLLEGMGLWFPLEPEITDTAAYNVAATHARRAGRGIWQDDLCGPGPQAGHPIELWVKSDADGDDRSNLNDEYVRVVNRHPSATLDLGGWLLRESSQFRQDPREEGFRFPAGVRVPPGELITVRVGAGVDTADTFHMGSTTPLFDNADRTVDSDILPIAELGMGDGAYLLDPIGNVRASYTWPCVVDCSTPLRGALVIHHVEYDPPGVDTADNEYVELRNASNQRIHLDGYQLRNIFVAHEFTFGTYLDPGELLRVYVGDGVPTRTVQYWGQPDAMLRNSGDRVDVLSFDERYVDCFDWGTGRDCPWPVRVPGAGTTGALPTAPELRVPAPAPDPTPGQRFSDVDPRSVHAPAIAWLVEQEITSGCGGDRFCPAAVVTRAQMATFLTKALDLPAGDASGFDDVLASNAHVAGIGALVQAEITSGCGGGRFCPAEVVTRAQMATFLTNALELTPIDDGRFDDVGVGARHGGAIGALAEARITGGCGGGDFCPQREVTRAQMATFLRNALE